MGSSQPTPPLGDLSWPRRDIIPDSRESNQPTSRGANLTGRRREIVPADRLSRSVTQETESGSSNSPELSGCNSAQQIVRQLLAPPAHRLWSIIIQKIAYTEPEMEPDRQGHMEPVRHSDDSSNQYQISNPGDETEPETEPAGESLSGADERTLRRGYGPQSVETHGNNRPRTVRISSNSGS